jgi:hypothetical protein
MPSDLQTLALRAVRETAPDLHIAHYVKCLRDLDGGTRSLPEYREAIEWAQARPIAATLPLGSIIAGADATFTKRVNPGEPSMPWFGGPDTVHVNEYSNEEIDDMVRRGEVTVLRVGDGTS